jgi:hypothetical protein
MRDTARSLMRNAFFTESPTWKKAVLAQSRDAAAHAIDGLAGWR